jgi:sortase A
MHTVRRIIAGLGRSFISTGVLVLLFVIYELYGTSLQELSAQTRLKDGLKKAGVAAQTTVSTVAPAIYVPPAPPPAGDALATLKIDKLGLYKAVVEGVDTNDLKKGPGHYAGTPLPGEAGNVAIAGHRTTYGAPFYRINELAVGDPIQVTTKQGNFTYKVSEQKVVGPNDNFVLDNTPDRNILTLTTCHPRFSASQRLIIIATLDGPALGVRDLSTYGSGGPALQGDENAPGGGAPAPAANTATTAKPGIGVIGGVTNSPNGGQRPGGTTASTSTAAVNATKQRATTHGGVSGRGVPRGPAIQWGIIAALVALGAYIASRRWRKWPAYALGAPVFLFALYFFFENFASLLPANV